MEKDIPLHLQQIIFSSAERSVSRAISKLLKEGRLRKIAPKVYTSNLEEDPEDIIYQNSSMIIGDQYPGILLSHCSVAGIQADDYRRPVPYL